jgi:hypothetical protein
MSATRTGSNIRQVPRSLRRASVQFVQPSNPVERLRNASRDRFGPALRTLVVGASVCGLVTGVFLPIPVEFGPFDSAADSRDYLQTSWQVVAAALALSVAMIAFTFGAFLRGAEGAFGLTLAEFARDAAELARRLGSVRSCVYTHPAWGNQAGQREPAEASVRPVGRYRADPSEHAGGRGSRTVAGHPRRARLRVSANTRLKPHGGQPPDGL